MDSEFEKKLKKLIVRDHEDFRSRTPLFENMWSSASAEVEMESALEGQLRKLIKSEHVARCKMAPSFDILWSRAKAEVEEELAEPIVPWSYRIGLVLSLFVAIYVGFPEKRGFPRSVQEADLFSSTLDSPFDSFLGFSEMSLMNSMPGTIPGTDIGKF